MRVWRAVWPVTALALVVGLAGYVALGSETFTRLLLKGTQAVSGGRLQYGELSGSLRQGLHLRDVSLHFDGGQAQMADMDWTPDLGALWQRRLALGHITLHKLRLELDASAAGPSPEPLTLPLFAVPGRVTLAQLKVLGLEITTGGNEPLRIDELRLGATLVGSRLQVRDLAAFGAGWAAVSTLRLDFAGDAPLEGQWQGHLESSDGTRWQVAGHLGGAITRSVQATLSVASPVQGRLVASIDTPLADGPWQARMQMDGQSLAAFRSALPPWLLTFDGRAHGRGADADVVVAYGLEGTPAGSLRGHLKGHGQTGHWQIDAQVLGDVPASRVDLAGQIDLAASAMDVLVDWKQLRWPLVDPAQVVSPSGSARLQGNLADWLLTLDAELQAQGQTGALTARVFGDSKGARVQQLTARVLGGSLDGQGLVHWSPTLGYELDLRAAGFNPGLLSSQWPGHVDALLSVAGQGEQLALHLSELSGQLRGQALGGSGALAWNAGVLSLDKVAVRMGRARLRADGAVGLGKPLRVDLSVPAAGELLPGARGSLTAMLRLEGAGFAHARLKLDAAGLGYGDLAAQSLNADIDLNRPQDVLRLRVAAGDVKLADQRLALRLSADGRAGAHDVQIDLEGGDWQLALAGSGAVLDDGWRGRFATGTVNGLSPARWNLAQPLALELRRAQQVVGQHCWQAQEARLCAGGSQIDRVLQLAAELQRLPLAGLMGPDVSLDSSLGGQLDLRRADGLLLGEARLDVPAGRLSLSAPDGEPREFQHGAAVLSARFGADGTDMAARLAGVGAPDLISASLRLPALPGVPGAPLPLSGVLAAQLPDIGLAEPWLPGVEDLAGRFEADLKITGTAQAPNILGVLRVRDGEAALPRLGIELSGLSVDLTGEGEQTVRVAASAKSGKGSLTLTGTGRRDAPGGLQAALALRGENFRIMDTAALQARVTPVLDFNIDGDALAVTGSVQVPYARIKVVDTPAAVTVSPDVVLRGRAQPTGRSLAARADVRLVLGDDVRVSAHGFAGSLGGALRLRQGQDGTTSANGTVRVEQGQYMFYGQRLPVTEGLLRYAGGPPDNPGLRITAARKVGEVTAGVRLRGTAKAPDTQLFSTPPMQQSEILSYLVLGRPLRQASSAQGDLLMQAASSVGMRGGSALTKRIGQALGFDEAKLGSDDNGGANLALGRYLTPQLYIGYGVGLADQANAVTLRYTLSEHLLLEVLSGLTQTADLLYKVER
ncbi:MAG: translocation/assembly module TamB domain-containing protein [Immundisolibacter sp.]|uniref:translocation/assembly module TamB domain-containing protein n=1 Tax=Immundisolibacter sp. TaxID=1934948 RepID=UPI003EE247BE